MSDTTPDAAEQLAEALEQLDAFAEDFLKADRPFTADIMRSIAALIRAQAAEIARLTALDTPATPSPAEPAGDALLPCPFCGGMARRVTITDEAEVANIGGDVITCIDCDACTRVFFGEKEGLREAWNRRAAGWTRKREEG